jgi:mannose-6-phosphate isomerase-like protein (cupin superfamily)
MHESSAFAGENHDGCALSDCDHIRGRTQGADAGGQALGRADEHGTMRLLYYAPKGVDPQQPHKQDELYVVASGNGAFLCGTRRAGFVPGDVLFAPAGGAPFENFSDDFAVWVIFYGPEGGEH